MQCASVPPDQPQQAAAAFLGGRISFARSSKHRGLDISLESTFFDASGKSCSEAQALVYDIAPE